MHKTTPFGPRALGRIHLDTARSRAAAGRGRGLRSRTVGARRSDKEVVPTIPATTNDTDEGREARDVQPRGREEAKELEPAAA